MLGMERFFPKTLWGFYWLLTKRFWAFILGSLFLALFLEVPYFVLPQLSVKWISDAVENAVSVIPLLPQVLPVIIFIGTLRIVMCGADIIYNWIRGRFGPLVKVKTAEIVYDEISRQSVAFFKDNSAGYLVEQGNYLINKFQRIMIDHIGDMMIFIFALVINGGLLLQVHWTVAALFGMSAAYRLIHGFFHLKPMCHGYKHASKMASLVTAKYVDSISNFMNLKLFARKNDERVYLNKTRMIHATARQKANFLERKFWVIPYSVEQICGIGVIFMAVYLYQMKLISVGDIGFSIISFSTMMSLIRKITWKLPEITDDLASVNQAYRDLAKPITITDAKSAKSLNPKKCDIVFDNISFKYTDDQWIFRDLSLCISPGEKVGIVGLSGSGKSTLLYLLMRLYDVNKGAIKIDGRDIRMITMDSLRGVVSFVPQDCTLFNRTLAENISYGAIGARKADIVDSAKKAEAHGFIMRTENGYDTCVGDRGIALSGGQRQRIAIAHAICKNAPIIVMDEATSALDSKTERAVQNALGKMLKNRTAIVVAHRLSTLRKMDRIIVLDRGRIIEEGPHIELIKIKDGVYAKLWSMQTDGFVK